MQKKLTYIAVLTFVIILLGTIKVYAVLKFELSVDRIKDVEAGKTVTLIIRGDNISEQENKISGIKFDIFYDTNNLEFVSADKLDAASGTIDLNENYPEEGRIRIGMVSLTGLNKSGELYKIELKAKEKLNKKEVEIRLEPKEIIDKENNEIPCEVKNGAITFKEKTGESKEEIIEENKQEVTNINENINQNESHIAQTQENLKNTNQITIITEENKNIKELLNENGIMQSVDEANMQKEQSKFIIYILIAIVAIVIIGVLIKILRKK